MGNDPVRADPVLSKLRKLGPHRIVLDLRDGETRSIIVPTKGTKWRKLGEMLEAQAWTSLEAFDRDGNLLGSIDSPDEDEDDDDDEDDVHDVETSDERMARVIAGVVKDTMAATASMFQNQLAGQAALVQAMTEGMHQVTESYSQALRVQAASQAAGALEGDSNATQQVLGMLAAFMMKGGGGGASMPAAIPADSREVK